MDEHELKLKAHAKFVEKRYRNVTKDVSRNTVLATVQKLKMKATLKLTMKGKSSSPSDKREKSASSSSSLGVEIRNNSSSLGGTLG